MSFREYLNEGAPKNLVFKGYQDIVTNLWDLEDDEVSPKVQKTKWYTQDVLFVDTDEMYDDEGFEDLEQQLGENEKEKTIKYLGKSYKVFLISNEGFRSFLMQAKDYSKDFKYVRK